MGVDQPRHDELAAQIDHARPGSAVDGGSDCGNATVPADANLEPLGLFGTRFENTTLRQDQ